MQNKLPTCSWISVGSARSGPTVECKVTCILSRKTARRCLVCRAATRKWIWRMPICRGTWQWRWTQTAKKQCRFALYRAKTSQRLSWHVGTTLWRVLVFSPPPLIAVPYLRLVGSLCGGSPLRRGLQCMLYDMPLQCMLYAMPTCSAVCYGSAVCYADLRFSILCPCHRRYLACHCQVSLVFLVCFQYLVTSAVRHREALPVESQSR